MSTTPPDDPADALVRDLGFQPGAIAISQSINNSTLDLSIPNMTFDTSSSTNKKVFVWGLNSGGNTANRYGTYSIGSQLGANPVFSCQATNFVKKCKVLGFTGNTKTYERDVYLRVYREVVDGAFNLYREERVQKPVLPRKGDNVPSNINGKGSIPNSAFANGFYNVLFIGWKDYDNNKRFALVDWYVITDPYHNLEQYKERVVNLSQKPTGAGAGSASGSTALANNFITSNYNGGIQGGSGGRIPLPKIAGRPETNFFLTDALPGQITEQSGSLPVRSSVPATVTQPTFRGSQLKLVDEFNSALPGFRQVGTTYPYGSQTLKYSRFYVDYKGNPQQILVSDSTYSEIEGFFKDIEKISAGGPSLSKVDNIELKPGVNYVSPNLTFNSENETSTNWGTRRRADQETFFNGIVVGSSSAPFSAATTSLNNTIEGIVPGATSRSDYIYLLPGWGRSNVGSTSGVVFGSKITSYTVAETRLNDPQACNLGRHAGKFLKSAGFTHAGVQAYAKALENHLQNLVMKALSSQTLNGYFVGYAVTTPKQLGSDPAVSLGFKFSLQGYANLPIVAGLPQTFTTSTTVTTEDTDKISKNYLKVINDAKNTITTKGTVDIASLQQAIYFSARLGLPIQQFRDQTLQLIKDGKIAYLMKVKNKTQAQAEEEWKKDPLYTSLSKIFATGGAGYSGGSSGSSGSAGYSGGSSGSAGAKKKNTKNAGKNNKGGNADTKQASSKPETIKITVTRGLAGYRTGIRSTGQTSSKPTLIQTYEGLKSSKEINGSPIRSFVFPFVPNNVNYSGLGINWTEIERTGGYPIVDWTSFQLLKISFNFDIVSMAQENQAGFGLYYSCEDQIQELREMAQAPYPVTFLNMDKFMQDELRWPSLNTGRGIEFVIQEFSVTAVQRTPTNPTALKFSPVANQISRASCTMTLQEIPIERVDIVQMPPMKPCKKECDKDKITTEKDSYVPLFTPTISRSTG